MIVKNPFLIHFGILIGKNFVTRFMIAVYRKNLQNHIVLRHVLKPKVNRENFWHYFLKWNGLCYPICCKLYKDSLKVSEKKLRAIQGKVQNGDSFEERQANHDN